MPASPTSTWAGPAQRARAAPPTGHRPQWRPGAHGAQAGGHEFGVAGPQRMAQGAGAVATARPSTRARAVIDLEPGSRTVGRDRPVGGRRGPGRCGGGQVRHASSVRVDSLGRDRHRAVSPGTTLRGTVCGMCGRYASTRSAPTWPRCSTPLDETDGARRPTTTSRRPTRRRSCASRARPAAGCSPSARWGLVPPWARDPTGAARMINARAETVADSRAFAQSFAQRRCLVPADGWYEWVRRRGRRSSRTS